MQHFWSLAIEEQFYLVFPLLLVGMTFARGPPPFASRRRHGTRGRRPRCWDAVLFSPGHDPSRVYYGTDTRAVELLVGALLAIALTGRRRLDGPKVRVAVAAGGVVALGALVTAGCS